MYDKAVDSYFFLLDIFPNRYKTQKICDSAVSGNPFLILYCPNKYIT